MPRVEDGLRQVLASPSAADDLIDVVLRFELPQLVAGADAEGLAERRQNRAKAMSETIEQALQSAGRAAGQMPAQISVFPALGSAYVQAKRHYVRELLNQPVVTGAMLNANKPTR